jgi:hypothetical protein
VYVPPIVVARLTLYEVAPDDAVHVSVACALPAAAVTLVGADGAIVVVPLVGVTLAWEEFALSPALLTALTT